MSANNRCPRPNCGGTLIQDAYGDRQCLTCSRSPDDETPLTNKPLVDKDARDPYVELIEACKKVATWLQRDYEATAAQATRRKEEKQRVEKALAALSGGRTTNAERLRIYRANKRAAAATKEAQEGTPLQEPEFEATLKKVSRRRGPRHAGQRI